MSSILLNKWFLIRLFSKMLTNVQLSPLGRGCGYVGHKKLIPWFSSLPTSDLTLHINTHF